MRITLTLLIVALSFMTGCGNKDAAPRGILSHKEMQAVVWDMMRTDQFLNDFVLNKDTSLVKKEESIKMYKQVLAIHGLTQEEFRKNMDYYRSHPSLMKAIMDSIGKMSIVEETGPKPVIQPGSDPVLKTDTPPKIEKPRSIIDTPRRLPVRKQAAPAN
jgi:Domain of unknown function (DUF4296)